MPVWVDEEQGEAPDKYFLLPDGTPINANGQVVSEDEDVSQFPADHVGDAPLTVVVEGEGEGITPVSTLEPEVDEEVEAEEESYSAWTNDELRGEIAGRNEGRADEDKLSLEGKKADLIATLEADDAAGE